MYTIKMYEYVMKLDISFFYRKLTEKTQEIKIEIQTSSVYRIIYRKFWSIFERMWSGLPAKGTICVINIYFSSRNARTSHATNSRDK